MDDVKDYTIGTLAEGSGTYLIPVYQRAFAWSEMELRTLVMDISDAMRGGDDSYYLGVMVAFCRSEDLYEVIDGQQRLTALTLLLSMLPPLTHPLTLQYEARPTDDAAMRAIEHGEGSDPAHAFSISRECLEAVLEEEVPDRATFLSYLCHHVHILRVIVGEDTDLNRYFEIMNSRTGQLEAHQVLLDAYVNELTDEKEKEVFSLIWNGISYFDGYLQQGIPKRLWNRMFFGEGHAPLLDVEYDAWWRMIVTHVYGDDDSRLMNIDEILSEEDSLTIPADDAVDESDVHSSVLDFPHFLLLSASLSQGRVLPSDDKLLIPTLLNEVKGEDAVRKFGYDLLRYRYLFDQYIPKKADGGVWTLSKYIDEHEFISTFLPEDEARLLPLLTVFAASYPDYYDYAYLMEILSFVNHHPHVEGDAYFQYLSVFAKAWDKMEGTGMRFHLQYRDYLACGKEAVAKSIVFSFDGSGSRVSLFLASAQDKALLDTLSVADRALYLERFPGHAGRIAAYYLDHGSLEGFMLS